MNVVHPLNTKLDRDLLLAAASSAAAAAAELMRMAREGGEAVDMFESDIVEQLADAAKMALDAEAGHPPTEERNQLHGALCRYLEDWV